MDNNEEKSSDSPTTSNPEMQESIPDSIDSFEGVDPTRVAPIASNSTLGTTSTQNSPPATILKPQSSSDPKTLTNPEPSDRSPLSPDIHQYSTQQSNKSTPNTSSSKRSRLLFALSLPVLGIMLGLFTYLFLFDNTGFDYGVRETYSNDSLGVTIEVPKGMNKEEFNEFIVGVTFTEPGTSNYYEGLSLVIVRDKGFFTETINEELLNRELAEEKEFLKYNDEKTFDPKVESGIVDVSSSSVQLAVHPGSNTKALYKERTITREGTGTVKEVSWEFIELNGDSVRFSLTIPEEEWNTNVEELKNVLNSLSFN